VQTRTVDSPRTQKGGSPPQGTGVKRQSLEVPEGRGQVHDRTPLEKSQTTRWWEKSPQGWTAMVLEERYVSNTSGKEPDHRLGGAMVRMGVATAACARRAAQDRGPRLYLEGRRKGVSWSGEDQRQETIRQLLDVLTNRQEKRNEVKERRIIRGKYVKSQESRLS